jgi:hypothetical protein
MPSAPQAFYSRETLTPLTCPTEDISSILSSLLNSSWFVFLSSSRLSTKTDVGSARRGLAEDVESMRLFLFSEMREENRLRWDRMAGNAVWVRSLPEEGACLIRRRFRCKVRRIERRCDRGRVAMRMGGMTYSRVRRKGDSSRVQARCVCPKEVETSR